MTPPRLDPARRDTRREHLMAELGRDARQRHPRRVAAATLASLVVGTGVLLLAGGATNASIVERATAAISRPETIYHAVVEEHVRTAPARRLDEAREFDLLHELWYDPGTGRTRRRLWTIGRDGTRSALQSETVETWTPGLTDRPLSRLDALSAVRAAYLEGRCRCDDPRQVSYAGRPALVLRFERRSAGGTAPRSHVIQTVTLASDTLHPLRVDIRTRDASFHNDHRLVFRTFEELPATPANARLLEARAP